MLVHCKTVHPEVPFEQFKQDMAKKFTYNCTQCDKQYAKIESFEDHVQVEHENVDNKVPCEACGQLFKTKFRERGHFYSVHRTKRGQAEVPRKLENPFLYYDMADMDNIKCRTCKKTVKRDKLKDHHNWFHNPNRERIPCPHSDCDMSFKSQSFLNQHISFKHRKWDVDCGVCSKILPNRAERAVHLRKVHSVTLLVHCKDCRLVSTAMSMKKHKCWDGNFGNVEDVMVR